MRIIIISHTLQNIQEFLHRNPKNWFGVQRCMLSIISRFTSCSFLSPKTTVCERDKDTHLSSGGTAEMSLQLWLIRWFQFESSEWLIHYVPQSPPVISKQHLSQQWNISESLSNLLLSGIIITHKMISISSLMCLKHW